MDKIISNMEKYFFMSSKVHAHMKYLIFDKHNYLHVHQLDFIIHPLESSTCCISKMGLGPLEVLQNLVHACPLANLA
jgi:hypothetical protein